MNLEGFHPRRPDVVCSRGSSPCGLCSGNRKLLLGGPDIRESFYTQYSTTGKQTQMQSQRSIFLVGQEKLLSPSAFGHITLQSPSQDFRQYVLSAVVNPSLCLGLMLFESEAKIPYRNFLPNYMHSGGNK